MGKISYPFCMLHTAVLIFLGLMANTFAADVVEDGKIEIIRTMRSELNTSEPSSLNYAQVEYCPNSSCEVIRFSKSVPLKRQALFSFLYFSFGSRQSSLTSFRNSKKLTITRVISENMEPACEKNPNPGICLMKQIAMSSPVQIFDITYREDEKCETESTYVYQLIGKSAPANIKTVCQPEH